MKKLINSTKWLLAAAGVLMIVVGVMIFANPLASAWSVASAVGWLLLVVAVIDIVTFAANFQRFYAGWLLVRGLATGVFGALLAFQPALSVDVMVMVFGIWIIVNGAVQFANSFVARALGQKEWLWPMIGGIVEVAAGAIMLFNTGLGLTVTAYVLAASLIVDGVVSLIDAFKIQQGINEVKKWEKAVAKLVAPEE